MADPHYNAVIVGSGFGGSVMAYRLAEAGMTVCVLERGKAYPPGSFARSPTDFHDNFWDPSQGRHGLYNIWSFRGIDGVVASGLGGGSLIYANVLLRKDEKWFVREDLHNGGYEYWPVTRAELDPHYAQVQAMLNAQRYPFDQPGYDVSVKTLAMKQAADVLGLDWQLPKLAVAFGNSGRPPRPGEPLDDRPGHNRYGMPRSTCRLCGECWLGCNYGSKETLDLTYLSRAEREGAQLQPRCEVRAFAPTDSNWEVEFVRHKPEAEGSPRDTSSLPVECITCDYLVLAAGTFGSTYLLLKMRQQTGMFAELDKLGSRFSGNGDLLTLVMNSREDGTTNPRRLLPTVGPTITSAIRVPDRLDGGSGRGFYVEDAGFPQFIAWMAELAGPRPSVLWRLLGLVKRYIFRLLRLNSNTNLGDALGDALGTAQLTGASLPLLNMGRDVPNGRVFLNRGNRLDVDWELAASEQYVDRVRAVSKDIARALNGEFRDNPLTFLRRLITVHPLGGCPMGRDAAEGVVSSRGEVFGYRNLYVVDGAVMPGPVGPNPALTIGALANSFADHLISRWSSKRVG